MLGVIFVVLSHDRRFFPSHHYRASQDVDVIKHCLLPSNTLIAIAAIFVQSRATG